jgi:hypothetical protein
MNNLPDRAAVPENLKSLANQVVQLYRGGHPVMILDKEGTVLHGQETLQVIADTGAGLKVMTIEDVDRQQFEACDLPEICEAARQNWLKDKFSKD